MCLQLAKRRKMTELSTGRLKTRTKIERCWTVFTVKSTLCFWLSKPRDMADLSSGRLKTGTKIDRWSASGDRWCPGTIIDNDCYLFEYQDGDHMWINRKETDQYRLTPNAGQHDVFERESQSQQVLSAVSENHLNINTMRMSSVILHCFRFNAISWLSPSGKGQDVEIYDLHRKRWTLGEIYEIREVDDQKTFCIEYDEYCQEIPEEDVQSLLRIPKTDDKANDHEVESKRSIPRMLHHWLSMTIQN